jgi:hypothetical protein
MRLISLCGQSKKLHEARRILLVAALSRREKESGIVHSACMKRNAAAARPDESTNLREQKEDTS